MRRAGGGGGGGHRDVATDSHLTRCPPVPPEERANLWVVEADVSPELQKRAGRKKKRRKKKKKEVTPDPEHCLGGSEAPSAVPRLPRLPPQPCLVAFAPDVLPAIQPRATFPGGRRGDILHVISNPFCPESGAADPDGPGRWQHNGGSLWPPLPHPGVPRTQGHPLGLAPIHSRTNLVEAELLEPDSDF